MAADVASLRQRGFTLIEAIVVIVITGIIAAMISTFIRAPVDAYADTVRRAQLTDTADTALRRIARDLRTALPNSLRQPAGGTCIEFLPTLAGGRYRADPSSGGGGDILDFTKADSSFEVLGSVNLSAAAATNLVAIYNLGISGADAYAGDTATISSIATAGGTTTINLSPSKQFLLASPGRRFQIIPNSSTVYLCTGAGTLVRYTQPITGLVPCPTAVPPSATSSAVLASNVATGCGFSYTPAVTTRSGLLSMQLGLAQGGESVTLYQEVHVDNVP